MDVKSIIRRAEQNAMPLFEKIEKTAYFNQKKVVDAFRQNKVSARHFYPTTGYGYDDIGKDCLSRVFATAFGADKAIVSPLFASGTHALTVSLFGLLRPGDKMLSVTGDPYDTLLKVIQGEGTGSLRDYNIGYEKVDLKDGRLDYQEIEKELLTFPKLVFITRSKGYSLREALSIEEIQDLCSFIKKHSKNSIIFVDNCYGEFIDEREPVEVGADVIVGSLIKNPGGGLAPTGAYVAGKAALVDQIANRLTAPSLGTEIGSYYAGYLPFFQGFFMAPSIVESALKTSVLAAYVFTELGYEVIPPASSMPRDIIRAIKFNDKEKMIKFIQNVQYGSPVDAHVTPYPWEMPGYTCDVIMAAGTFMQGGSIELSADAPVRPPYIAYLQGGLTYHHGKAAIEEFLMSL